MKAADVVVVGGGLAGLAAAVRCADAGASVTLLESRPRLGGAAGSFRRGDITVDTGQHVFLRCCAAYRGFLRRLGTHHLASVQDRLDIPVASPDGRRARLRRSRLPAPLHLAGALATYPFLRPAERVRAAVAAAALARLDRDGAGLDEQTFGNWLTARGQSPPAVAALWDLIALPALNLPAAEASLDLAAMVFQTGLLRSASAGDIGIPLVPLTDLHAEPAAAALRAAGGEVHLQTRAVALDTAGPRPAVVLADGDPVEADAVVVAVPHDDAATLLPPGAVPRSDRLGELGTVPICNVHVFYDRRVTRLPFVAGIDTPVQWVFDRTAPSGYDGGQYLAISLSAARDDVGRRTADLLGIYLPELARLLPAAGSARVVDAFVTREPAATFRQGPGTRSLRPGPVTRLPRVFLAGAWTDTGWPATMEGAVRSGLKAADAALAALAAPNRTEEVAA